MGQEYFDEEIYDHEQERVDTLPFFLKNIATHNLEEFIKPLVMDSESASKIVENNINMIFIDGSHTFNQQEMTMNVGKIKLEKAAFLQFMIYMIQNQKVDKLQKKST